MTHYKSLRRAEVKWFGQRFFLFSGLVDEEIEDEERLVKIAASLELLHSATLIHDDVIDDSLYVEACRVLKHNLARMLQYTRVILFIRFTSSCFVKQWLRHHFAA